MYHLPYTNFQLHSDNRVARQLWGRLPFVNASAFLYFHKGTRVQNLMHQLKYAGKIEIGQKLGEMCGDVLAGSDAYRDVDLIIPVPLHARRLKERGYNQSECFARGLSLSMNVEMSEKALKRVIGTPSQTRKSRFSRYENMLDAFEVALPELVSGKHILLVDDVITTGATIEACGLKLLEQAGVKISIATIAFTD